MKNLTNQIQCSKIVILFLFQIPVLFGQVEFQSHLISDQIAVPSSIIPVDLDNDGDMDILSTSYNDNEVIWQENIDGQGTFGPLIVISDQMNESAVIAFADDLDSDGDVDVVSASFDKLAWYPNNGDSTFGGQIVIDLTTAGWFIDLEDLDGDGDIDILALGGFSSIVWYENLDGQGGFSSANEISNLVSTPLGVYAEDLDGDGDLDVLSASKVDNKIAWYENLGGGTFGSQQIITVNATSAYHVTAADLDNDGDMDVLSAQEFGSHISWFENLDGNGNFSSANEISGEASEARFVHFGDLDNDGDMDVLSASRGDNKIAWYQNDGSGNFGNQIIINDNAFLANMVYSGDLDNDGDIDVMSSDFGDLIWYENLSPLSIDEISNNEVMIYPNPNNGIVYISLPAHIQLKEVALYNNLVQRVMDFQSNKLDLSAIKSGVYYLKIVTDKGQVYKTLIRE